MKNRILFVVNGLGLGNSTRCYSVIQELYDLGYVIEVATSGNGLVFFRGKPEIQTVHTIGALLYGKDKRNRLNIARTLLGILLGLGVLVRNAIFLTKLIKERNPALVVYDSQYSILPKLFCRFSLVALNNSDKIVDYFFETSEKPLDLYPQFFLIELMDFFFHRFFPNAVMSPWVKVRQPASGRFRDVGLIVRRGIGPSPASARPARVLIMLSGSTFGGSLDPASWGMPYTFDVVGREGENSRNVRYHGRLVDNLALLREADVLIVNGGFSAVSEAMALRKPTLVLPVERHAEQWVNAQLVEDLGLGLVATHEDVATQLARLIEDFPKFASAALRLEVPTAGAQDCARFLHDWCLRQGSTKSRRFNTQLDEPSLLQ